MKVAAAQMSINETEAESGSAPPELAAEDFTRAIELFEGYRIVAADRATRITQLVHRVDQLKAENRALQTRTRRAEETVAATKLSLKATRRELRKTQNALKAARTRRAESEAQLRRFRQRRSVRIAVKISAALASLKPGKRKARQAQNARKATKASKAKKASAARDS